MALKISSSGNGSSGGGRRAMGKNVPARNAVRQSIKNPAPARRAVNTPVRSQAPAQYSSPQTYSSQSFGGSPGGGFVEPPAPAVPTEADYLAGDSTYQATLAALKKQLQNFNSDITSQRNNRKLDYDKSLKDLGYVAPDPNARGAGPNWNWQDTLTASGRANQNQLNDFASRGMLQSSGYADSFQDLTRSLLDQYTGIDQANTQFNTDLDRQVARAKDENTSASQAARAEAIMRRAAQYGFGV